MRIIAEDIQDKNQDAFEGECIQMAKEKNLGWEDAVRFVVNCYDQTSLRGLIGDEYYDRIVKLYELSERSRDDHA